MAFTRRTNAPLVELHGLHALRGEAKVEAKESDAGAVVAGAAVNDPMEEISKLTKPPPWGRSQP